MKCIGNKHSFLDKKILISLKDRRGGNLSVSREKRLIHLWPVLSSTMTSKYDYKCNDFVDSGFIAYRHSQVSP